jgi:hypothetical protein
VLAMLERRVGTRFDDCIDERCSPGLGDGGDMEREAEEVDVEREEDDVDIDVDVDGDRAARCLGVLG